MGSSKGVGPLNNGHETMDAEDENTSADVPENNALTDIVEESPSYLPLSKLSRSNLQETPNNQM